MDMNGFQSIREWIWCRDVEAEVAADDIDDRLWVCVRVCAEENQTKTWNI